MADTPEPSDQIRPAGADGAVPPPLNRGPEGNDADERRALDPARQGWQYCQRCRHRLPDQYDPDHVPRCPECRLPYDPLDPTTYDSLPLPRRWKSTLAIFVLTVIFGVSAYAAIFVLSQMDAAPALGSALFLAVPFAVGALLGFLVRPGIWLALLVALIAVPTMVLLVVCIGLHGYFCGLTLSAIFVPPTLVGVVTGAMLRMVYYNAAWDGRRYFFLGGLALLPFLADLVERKVFPMTEEISEVRTAAVFPGTPRAAWDNIVFYEEVSHEPPWLLRLALPRPVRAEGRKQEVGDVERCVYRKGHLVKEITERVEGERLAFRVVVQNLHFERDATLRDGVFLLEPVDQHHTRVTLSTRYSRHLRPAWIWEGIERKVIHTLHGHVLEGMRRRLPAADEPSPRIPETELTRE